MEKITEIKKWVIEQVIWAETELNGKSGAEKKAAVVKKLDDLIKLPIYLEWVDDMIIGYLVDQACEKLNYMTRRNFEGLKLNEEAKVGIAEAMETENDKR